MALTFTAEEKQLLKFTVFDLNVNPAEMDESSLPTDIHLVEYEVDGTLYVDMARAYKKVDIFDTYYDKLQELNGTLISITNGFGRIKPKLFNGPTPAAGQNDFSI